MDNPKTTILGYIGLAGTLMVIIGQTKPTSSWGQVLTQVGVVLSGGASSLGAVNAKDNNK